MSLRATWWALVLAGLAAAVPAPAPAFELPAQKLELIDNLKQAADRGDAERFARYLALLKAETGAFEQSFQPLPATRSGEQLPDVAGALIAAWAFLLIDTLAASPNAPDSAWRVASILLGRDKDWMVAYDSKLFNQFQRTISELRVLSNETTRDVIRADLKKRVTELVARSLKAS